MKPLTPRDIDLLGDVVHTTDDWLRQGFGDERWLMPMDVGGTNASHHSYTLHKLAARGLIDMKKYGGKRAKGSCRYWANGAGRKWLRENTEFYQKRARAEAHMRKLEEGDK